MIVGGCLKDIAGDILDKHFDGPGFTTLNFEGIDSLFPEFQYKIKDVPDGNFLHDYNEIDKVIGKREKIVEKFFFDRNKLDYSQESFTIRIGDGCNCRCTYCSHINAIGPYRSKALQACLDEFRKGYDAGYRLFRITSMDTGSYGTDIKLTLPKLLHEILEIHDDINIILEDINPMWINKYSDEIEAIAALGKIKVIQCPIQSGSAEILKKMKRWSNVDHFRDILNNIKNNNPGIILATETLLGFPTETDKNFRQTLSLLKEARFDFSYIYPYYENEYIESSKIYPKNSQKEISRRLESIIEFCDENRISYSVMLNYE